MHIVIIIFLLKQKEDAVEAENNYIFINIKASGELPFITF